MPDIVDHLNFLVFDIEDFFIKDMIFKEECGFFAEFLHTNSTDSIWRIISLPENARTRLIGTIIDG